MHANKKIEVNEIVRNILAQRGFDIEAEIDDYFSPIPQKTYDPFLLKDMDEASDLIIRYAEENRRICVYGDYDADGVTSVTLMLTVLKKLCTNYTYFIPSRFSDGYGLNKACIKKLFDDGVELIITVDCGCTSYEEVEYIKELGMQVVVTDHHSIEDRAAECLMINPKQKDDNYPFSYLCGCGVAFKLAQAIGRKKGFDKSFVHNLLDIVGIATVGDIVPLRDENRTLVKYGIHKIKGCGRSGLSELITAIKIDLSNLNSTNIAFGIVPHLNAAGRLKNADIGVKLLLSDKECAETEKLVEELISLNEQRKCLQDEIYENAVEYIDANCPDDFFIVYDAKEGHEGVTGIVAGKLKEKYFRPVIIVTETKESGIVKGTGRSIAGIDLFAIMQKKEELFTRFGGHAGACGFSMKSENVGELKEYLNEIVGSMSEQNPSLLSAEIYTDAEISSGDVSLELAEQIGMMEPFGCENERPVLKINNIYVKKIFCMGANKQFRKYLCSGEEGNSFDCVVFDQDVIANHEIKETDLIDVAGEISLNTWNGNTSIQIIVREIY